MEKLKRFTLVIVLSGIAGLWGCDSQLNIAPEQEIEDDVHQKTLKLHFEVLTIG